MSEELALIIESFSRALDPLMCGVIPVEVMFEVARKLDPSFSKRCFDELLRESGTLKDGTVDYRAFVQYMFTEIELIQEDYGTDGIPSPPSPAKACSPNCTHIAASLVAALDAVQTDVGAPEVARPVIVIPLQRRRSISVKWQESQKDFSVVSESDYLGSNSGCDDVPETTPERPKVMGNKSLLTTLDHFYKSIRTDMCLVDFMQFVRYGSIPRSDRCETTLHPEWISVLARRSAILAQTQRHCIFVSHRWLRPDAEPPHPDDEFGSKHSVIVAGVEALCEHRGWKTDQCDLWIDYACIDQVSSGEDSLKMLGVLSLLAYVARCDALLVPAMDGFRYPVRKDTDGTPYTYAHCIESYGERAWCRLEALCMWVVGLLWCAHNPPLYAVSRDAPHELVTLRVLNNGQSKASAGLVHSEDDRQYIQRHEWVIEAVYHRALIFSYCRKDTEEINLGGQSLDAYHCGILMNHIMTTCAGIRKINLAGNEVGDTGCKYIAQAVEFLPKLTHLHLAKNGITDEGAEVIQSAVTCLPSFVGLDMTSNPCDQSYWMTGSGFEYNN